MMSSTQDIIERLPEFFKTRSARSLLFQFIDGFGNGLRETERDLFRIMRGHWVDTAKGVDLDKLGAVFKIRRKTGEEDLPFRRRVKRAIQEYKGGGTRPAIDLALEAMFGPYAREAEVEEWPLTPIAIEI